MFLEDIDHMLAKSKFMLSGRDPCHIQDFQKILDESSELSVPPSFPQKIKLSMSNILRFLDRLSALASRVSAKSALPTLDAGACVAGSNLGMGLLQAASCW